MENDPVGPEIPKIESEVMRSDSEDKAGFLPGLLSKLGLGGASSAAAGVGSGIMASKAGIVALIVAGSSVAAGISMLTSVGNESRTASSQDSAAVFASLDSQSAAAAKKAAEERAAGQAPSADGASSSLNFFNEANKGVVADPTKPPEQNKEGSGEATEWADSAAKDSKVQAPQHDAQASAASPSVAKVAAGGLSRPTMAKKQGFGGTGGGGTSATLVASANMGGTSSGSRAQGGAAGGRMGAMDGGARGGRASGSKMTANLRAKNMAGDQLRAHGSALRGNLASGNVSSQGSGTVMDGGRGGGGTIGGGASGIGGGGVGSGAAGLDVGKVAENTNLDTKEVPKIAAKDTENKSAYQDLMYMAMAAMGVYVVCMLAFALIKNMLKKALVAQPYSAPAVASLLGYAKLVLGIATIAGGVATALGLRIATMSGGDQMIGGLMGAIGAFMTADAAYRLMTIMNVAEPKDSMVTPGMNEEAMAKAAESWTEKNMGSGLLSLFTGAFK